MRPSASAVTGGKVWLLAGPASLLGEPIPVGVLSSTAVLRTPPKSIPALAILPENLLTAWQNSVTTALAILAVFSQRAGHNILWKTVSDVCQRALKIASLHEKCGRTILKRPVTVT